MRSLKNILFLCAALALSGCDLMDDIAVGNGFSAKNICSGVFLSGQEERKMAWRYVGPEVTPLPLVWHFEVDHANQTVLVQDYLFNGWFKSKAVYREGLGCTLRLGHSIRYLDRQSPSELWELTLDGDEPWPYGAAGLTDVLSDTVDGGAIEAAIDAAFEEVDSGNKKTTSVVVAHRGKLIAERYRKDFNAFTPLVGWSMSKSVTSTLTGILVDRGALDVNAPAPIQAWQGTEKEAITLDNLLHMSSGLEYYEESRGENKDQARMLYRRRNQSNYVISKPLIHEPGTVYNYSTGETNVIARIIQEAVGGQLADAYEFYQTQLFHRIDIANATIEHDTAGYFIGGASVYMSARDWARLGQLYLQKGQWRGEQILSEDWQEYALTPSASNDEFGAHLWLNTNGKRWPSLPHDTFAFLGHQEQGVYIVPSKELVVVRTGFTFDRGTSEREKLVASIIDAIGE